MHKKLIVLGSVGLLSLLLVGCASNSGLAMPKSASSTATSTVDPHAQTLSQLAAAGTRSVCGY